MFAVLNPSEEELQIHYEAKALIDQYQKETQEAKAAAAEKRKQARSVQEEQPLSVQEEQAPVSGTSNKRKPPPRVARGGKRNKAKH